MNNGKVIAALSQQLMDPQHCHIRLGKELFSHSKAGVSETDIAHLKGRPVRFTRLAAEAIAKTIPGAVVVPTP